MISQRFSNIRNLLSKERKSSGIAISKRQKQHPVDCDRAEEVPIKSMQPRMGKDKDITHGHMLLSEVMASSPNTKREATVKLVKAMQCQMSSTERVKKFTKKLERAENSKRLA